MSYTKCSHNIAFEHYCHLCEEEIEEYFHKRKLHMEFCAANELVYEVTFEDYQRADFKQRKEIARWKHVTGFDDPESLKMYLSGQTIHQADDEDARAFARVSSENAELKKKLVELSRKFEEQP